MSAPKYSNETLTSFVFLSPFLIFFALFLVYPIFYSLYLSFFDTPQDYSLANLKFVGLDNYKEIIFHDKKFWWSLFVTAVYGALSIPFGIAASLGLALILNNKLFGKGFFRSAFFLPNILDMFVVALIWIFIYAPEVGALAQVVKYLFGETQFLYKTGVLSNQFTALPAVVFAMVLKGAGFGMVLFLAALQNIPDSVYEAADIDGASAWEQFWHITLPLLRPIIFFMIITGIIGALNAFTEIYAMTGGGPQAVVGGETLGATTVAGYYLFKQFDAGRYGYAAAISYILLIITVVITLIQRRLMPAKDM